MTWPVRPRNVDPVAMTIDPRLARSCALHVDLEMVAGRLYGPLDLQFRDWHHGGVVVDASSWGIRLVIRRTIDGAALVDIDETDGNWFWRSSDLKWRLQLGKNRTAALAPVTYPTLRPQPYEVFVYDIEVTPPGGGWGLPPLPNRFVLMGGTVRVYTSGAAA